MCRVVQAKCIHLYIYTSYLEEFLCMFSVVKSVVNQTTKMYRKTNTRKNNLLRLDFWKMYTEVCFIPLIDFFKRAKHTFLCRG